jgi:predicted GH43/DUF377 family glycosyl hydrolase
MILKLKRYEKNPVLQPNGNTWENLNVSNAAAAVYDGKVYLLYRAEGEDMRTPEIKCPVTRLGLAVSENGYDIKRCSDQPIFDRNLDDPWCEFGCEDPRISKIGDTYYIVYVTMSRFGYTGDRLAYATTKDFKTFTRHGLLMDEFEQRTSGFLPGKINDNFFLFHRPMPNMWGSFSKDLKNWTGTTCIFKTKDNTWYENKLGIGAPPVETPYGWLLFWHGKNNKGEYALGVMLLDKDDPRKIIKFQKEPVLECEMDYEKQGFVSNVVYTNGVVKLNGKFLVYYGCCDRCLALATVDEDEVNAWCTEK